MTRPDQLTDADRASLDAILAASPELAAVTASVRAFAVIMTERRGRKQHWTGYAGDTVWGWLGILLPLVFPTLLLPPLLKWVSGNAAGRASAGYQTAPARKAIAATRTLSSGHSREDAAKVRAGRGHQHYRRAAYDRTTDPCSRQVGGYFPTGREKSNTECDTGSGLTAPGLGQVGRLASG